MARSYERLSPEAMDEIWVRLRAGHAAKPTARQLGISTSTVSTYLLGCGGIRPAPRRRAPRRLSAQEREEISRGLAAGMSLLAIAAQVGRAPSTISREVATNGGPHRNRAGRADQMAWARATRPRRAGWLATRCCVPSWRTSCADVGLLSRSPAGSSSPIPTTRRCRCRTRASTARCSCNLEVRCAEN